MGTWVPYEGSSAAALEITLLAVALVLAYGGTKLKGAIGVKSPGKTVSVFLILIWVLSLVTFLVAALSYVTQLYPPIPPSPDLYQLLFFFPLCIVEISTFSLLTLSLLTKLSKYTLFSLGSVFYVFAMWAFLGFSYPSNLVPLVLNDLSKILSFVTAITLFLGAKTRPDRLSRRWLVCTR